MSRRGRTSPSTNTIVRSTSGMRSLRSPTWQGNALLAANTDRDLRTQLVDLQNRLDAQVGSEIALQVQLTDMNLELRQEVRATHELDDRLRADVGAFQGLRLEHNTRLFSTKTQHHSTTQAHDQ